MKKNRVIFIAWMMCLLVVPVAQVQAGECPSEQTSVTAYSSGQALITEVRTLELPESGEAPFPCAPATLDLTSVALRSLDQPGMVAVRSIRLLPSAADPSAVLRRFVGREVKVILPDPTDARARVTRKARLLSVGAEVVLDLGDEVYVGPAEAVLLPAEDGMPRAEAALLLDVRNRGAKKQKVEVSYLAGGLDWSGDCALTLDKAGETGALSCWATLRNNTGRAYHDAELRLVAGDVNRAAAPAPMARYKTMAMPVMEEAMDMGGGAQQAGDYQSFKLPYAANLEEGQVTRLALCAAEEVRVERELLVQGFALQNVGGAEPQRMPVQSALVMENTKERGLGAPLPASLVRIYRDLEDGGRILEGEASLGNLPAGETARLPLGTSFDVTARRTMLGYERIGKNRARVNWAVELRNAGAKPREVIVLERFQGEWKIHSESLKHTKVSADTARWAVDAPEGGKPVTLTYEAEMTW